MNHADSEVARAPSAMREHGLVLDHLDYSRQIRADVHRLADVARDAALSAPVPTCPGWDLRELVRHLGGVHTWATTYVASPRAEPIRQSLEEQVGGWPDDDELLDWFRDGGDRLADVIAEAEPSLETWTFLEAPTPLLFWARRQAHETAIHRVDAELTVGEGPAGFDATLAADGIDELLTAFITRPRRGPRHATPVALGVDADDVSRAWTVRFDAEGCATERGAAGETDVRAHGTADELYRWVWNRLPLDGVRLEGDRALAQVWRDTVQVKW